MSKPPKTRRPTKPPIIPQPEGEMSRIGLIHEKLIGRLSTQWAVLEATMGGAIIELLRVDYEAGRYVIGRMDATGLLRLLKELGQLRLLETDFHELSSICGQIDIRREERNLVIHGTWGRIPGVDPQAMSLRIKSEDPSLIISETFSRERLREIIYDIQSLRMQLVELLKLNDKQRERPLGEQHDTL